MDSSTGHSGNRVAYLLARVNAGLATQWSQIAELAASLQQMLDDAHALGESHVLLISAPIGMKRGATCGQPSAPFDRSMRERRNALVRGTLHQTPWSRGAIFSSTSRNSMTTSQRSTNMGRTLRRHRVANRNAPCARPCCSFSARIATKIRRAKGGCSHQRNCGTASEERQYCRSGQIRGGIPQSITRIRAGEREIRRGMGHP